jgi:hypothetical protein
MRTGPWPTTTMSRDSSKALLRTRTPVCTENSIRVDHVSESPNVGDVDRAIPPLPGLFVSPFKSKSRLEAEKATLRHQLIILRRKVRGRVWLTDGDRLFFTELYRCLMVSDNPQGTHNCQPPPFCRIHRYRQPSSSCSLHFGCVPVSPKYNDACEQRSGDGRADP